MIQAVTAALTTVIGWISQVVNALVGESATLGALLPLFAIGIAVSAFMLGMKAIRKVTWGA